MIPHIPNKSIKSIITLIYYKITNLLKYPIYPFFEHAILRVFRVFGLLSNTPSTIDEHKTLPLMVGSLSEIVDIQDSIKTIRQLMNSAGYAPNTQKED